MECRTRLRIAFSALLALPAVLPACRAGARTDRPSAAGDEPALDRRTPVALTPDGQQAVLREMRVMLGAMGGVMAGAAADDTAAVLAALLPAGSAAAADPALESSLPAVWRELAERTHGGFDSLAASVRRIGRNGLKDTVLVRLAQLSGSCTACHETFRVTVR